MTYDKTKRIEVISELTEIYNQWHEHENDDPFNLDVTIEDVKAWAKEVVGVIGDLLDHEGRL